jgi:hypothetical protein
MSVWKNGQGYELWVHPCVAIGCPVIVAARLVMCNKHWRLVPANVKGRILRAYRDGQERDGQLSFEYVVAMMEAIVSVKEQEFVPLVAGETVDMALGVPGVAHALGEDVG